MSAALHPGHWVGLACAAAGAVAFSGKAIIVKLAYRYGTDPVTLITLRMVLALPFFVAMAWWGGRRPGAVPLRQLSGRDRLGIVWLGFTGYYLASFLDFAGLQYITAALERLILYLNPTLVAVLGWLFFRRPLRRAQLLGMALSYAGVLLVFGSEAAQQGGEVALGVGLVFASAVSYALYLAYSGELVQRLGALRLVGWATSVACALTLVQFAVLRPWSGLATVAPEVWWLSALNATVCTVIPVVLVMLAIERLGAALASQVGMVGPMSTMAMGVLILGEPFHPLLLLGTALVIAGVFVCSRPPAAQG